MDPLIAIMEGDEPQEQSRLELYYQQLILGQPAQKELAAIEKTARNEAHSGQQDPSKDPQQQARDQFIFSGKGQDPVPTYDRHQLVKDTRTDAETASPLQATKPEEPLSADEKELIRRLQARDQEVRLHEMRHVAMLGPYAGTVQFHYQIGPDGKPYAIGGSVEVRDTGATTPEAKAERARILRNAALAGGDPSNSDLQATAKALQLGQDAIAELSAT